MPKAPKGIPREHPNAASSHMGDRCVAATSLRCCGGTPGDQDGRGTNELSKIESILGTRMSQNLSRDRRLACSCKMTGPGSLPAFRVEYPPHGTAQSLSSALQRVKSAPGQNHFSSGRAFTRCTGLLLGWCMMRLNFFTCSVETVSGCFITYQRTPSEQGGVVSDPLKR